MPMKELLYRLQPVQLYIILVLSIVYFVFQLFLSHITHSLTLLIDSYHMLCNIIALTGCILTIKHSNSKTNSRNEVPFSSTSGENFSEICPPSAQKVVKVESSTNLKHKIAENSRRQHERSLKNTFGWTRIDVLTMLIVCIVLASLSYSLIVEALQTLVHLHSPDAMHHPIWVLILGCLGLILNGLCYLLIGGYTYHQGSFLHITSSGTVILDRVVTETGVRQGERRLSKTKKDMTGAVDKKTKRENVRELSRDICSTVFVIICAVLVFTIDDGDILDDDMFSDKMSSFVDPVMAIISCILLVYLSYPYMKESGLILLQTIPATIDIECFKKSLLESFSDIISIHDLHIWQLSSHKYVSTAHIIFHDPEVYLKINEDVKAFFHEQGINIVTIQPEFKANLPTSPLLKSRGSSLEGVDCLMQCRLDSCLLKHCCGSEPEKLMLNSATNSVQNIPSTCEIQMQVQKLSLSTPQLEIVISHNPSEIASNTK